jgi:hypothetical protein
VQGGRLADDGDINITSSNGNKTVKQHQDWQIREGVEGGHLVADGDRQ